VEICPKLTYTLCYPCVQMNLRGLEVTFCSLSPKFWVMLLSVKSVRVVIRQNLTSFKLPTFSVSYKHKVSYLLLYLVENFPQVSYPLRYQCVQMNTKAANCSMALPSDSPLGKILSIGSLFPCFKVAVRLCCAFSL